MAICASLPSYFMLHRQPCSCSCIITRRRASHRSTIAHTKNSAQYPRTSICATAAMEGNGILYDYNKHNNPVLLLTQLLRTFATAPGMD